MSKPLAFPDAKNLLHLFEQVQPWPSAPKPDRRTLELKGSVRVSDFLSGPPGWDSFEVKPRAEVLHYIRQNMLDTGTQERVYFRAHHREKDDTVLISAAYNTILGDRWLAVLPADEVRDYRPEQYIDLHSTPRPPDVEAVRRRLLDYQTGTVERFEVYEDREKEGYFAVLTVSPEQGAMYWGVDLTQAPGRDVDEDCQLGSWPPRYDGKVHFFL